MCFTAEVSTGGSPMPSLPLSLAAVHHRRLQVSLSAFGALAWIAACGLARDGSRVEFVAVLLGGAFVVLLPLRWPVLLGIALGLLLVEALPRRYWVNEPAMFFVKDIALGIAYVKFVIDRWRTGRALLPRSPVTIAMGAIAVVVLLGAVNPQLPSLKVGLLGLHNDLWYMPIAILTASLFDRPADAVRAVRIFALTSLPLGVLAVMQLFIARVNASYYQQELGKTSYQVGSKFISDRSIGPFASTGTFSDYLVIVVVAIAALSITSRGRVSHAVIVALFGGIVLSMGGNGSRGLALAVIVACCAAAALTKRARAGAFTLAVGALSILSAFILYPVLPGLYRAVVAGFSTQSIAQRVTEHVVNPLQQEGDTGGGANAPSGKRKGSYPGKTKRTTIGGAKSATSKTPPNATAARHPPETITTLIIGHGTGLGGGGRQYLEPFLSSAQMKELEYKSAPESGWLGMAWEFGWVGVGVMLVFFGVLARISWRAYRGAHDDATRVLAAVGWTSGLVTTVLMVLAAKLGQIDYTMLFWASVGLAIAASRAAGNTA